MWRFFIPDTGYPSRAFAFGSVLGIVSSNVLDNPNLTYGNVNYTSRYKLMGLAMIGAILIWCTLPIVLLSSVYTSTSGAIIAMAGQINMWLALAGSALGVFSAASLYHKKFSVHEVVFTSFSVFICRFRGLLLILA